MNFSDDTLFKKLNYNSPMFPTVLGCASASLNLNNKTVGYRKSSDRIYIWLEANSCYIEERFRNLIHPYEWQHFKVVDACQRYIANQQLEYDSKIFLIARSSLAEALFEFEHAAKISNTYLYSNQDELLTPWIRRFPLIRGNYHSLDALYEQFSLDLECNLGLNSYTHQMQVCS